MNQVWHYGHGCKTVKLHTELGVCFFKEKRRSFNKVVLEEVRFKKTQHENIVELKS